MLVRARTVAVPRNVVEQRHFPKVVAGSEGRDKASGNTLSFADCLFDFSIQELPTLQTQRLAELLLRQNSPTVTLPLARSPST